MRKKFTMLLAALLACVGVAKADVTDLPQITTDLENPIYYTIYNTRSSEPGGLMYYAGDAIGLKDGCTSLTIEDKYKFYFTGSHEELYVHNAATTKKLASVNSWTDEGIAWTVTAPTASGLAFGPKGQTGNVFWNDKNFRTNENTSDFTVWSNTDAGSIFVCEKAEEFAFPVETGKFYVIECPLFENVQGVKKALYVAESGKAAWNTEDLTNHNYYWIPTVNEDGTVALKNFGTGTYLSATDGTMTETVANATLNALGNGCFNIILTNVVHANGHGGGVNASGSLTNWGGAVGSASAWTFVQKNDPTALQEVVVKYSFTYGGTEKYTQEVNTLVGEEWPAITVSFPYGVSSATKPAGEVTAEGAVDGVVTKTIELAVNLPFTYASDYASVENWYYLVFHASQRNYLYYATDDVVLEANKTAVDANDKDAYTWAFVGDPFNGFMVYNKKAEKYLDAAEGGAVVSANEEQVFDLTASAHGTNGFFMNAQNGAYTQRFNKNQSTGKVVYWSGADAGSTFMVELRDDAAALQALVNSANELLTNLGEGTAVGCVTADSKTAINNAIAAANTAIENNAGYEAAEIALQAAINALETIQPEEGKFYTIVSSCTKDHRAGQEVYVDKDGVMHFAKVGEVASEIARVFQFVPANDGKFYLYNIEKDAYMQSIGTATEFDVNKAKAVTIKNMGKDNIVSIKPDGQNQMHAQDRNSIIVGWNENNYTDGSAWKIVETELSLNDLTHTLTVTEAGWATLVLGYNTTIPAGVKAYAVSSIAEGKAVLAEVAKVLPAHTPVLIEAAAGSYEFNYTATEATVASNLLAGSVFNTKVAPVAGTTNYVLSNNGGVVALYKKTTTNDAGEIVFAANKAYLPVETATEGAPAMFSLGRGEGTTGIETAVSGEQTVVIYDLAGRRVEKMEKGIYIVNGKKVIR